ncbi:pentapeptide repeat-containing protein [Pantanalinema rosaneae CENA516]|uniref:pentapeptide repeat-containing protein n=1 Tax=Pantanalinema rosaneae TaxID=1620701 RepID=UPI003D6E54DB
MTHQNYANQNLQNCSFKRWDLTGADFHGADLRGCDFSGATLIGANLTGVKTGQSQRQINRLIVTTVLAPATIVGLSVFVVQLPVMLFGDRGYQGFNSLLGGLPLLLFLAEILFRDRISQHFPQTTQWLGVVGVAILFQIMVVFTLFLAIVGLLSFGDGSGLQGLFLLVLTVVSAMMTQRIYQWVITSVRSSLGTFFRKANLTDANLSQAIVQNTDFCFATFTGACIFDWIVQRHTQFTHLNCEYLYLESDYQKRLPTEGKFLPGEVETYLIATQTQSCS